MKTYTLAIGGCLPEEFMADDDSAAIVAAQDELARQGHNFVFAEEWEQGEEDVDGRPVKVLFFAHSEADCTEEAAIATLSANGIV